MAIKFNKNLILLVGAIIIAGVIVAGTFLYKCRGEEGLTPQAAAEKAINYINENLLQEGFTASLVSVAEENGVYKFHLKVGENEFDSYVTKDGKLLFVNPPIDLEEKPISQAENEAKEVSKRDIPDIKLFVMSYCPFGLQAQKMFLPVYNLLKDKAEMGVYFVNYIMHGKEEIDENLRQHCIQEEQKEKYYNYLACFVQDGDFEKCLTEAEIDKTKLAACISSTDSQYKITELYNNQNTWLNGQYPKFDVHTDLNEKYGVGGSPTIVINDTAVNIITRSPEEFKKTICQAFIAEPEECSQILSKDIPSAGFGGGTASSSGGGCQ